MEGKEIVVTENKMGRDEIELIKRTVAVGATDIELKLFLYQANKRGLDPLTRQIHFIKRKKYNPETEKYEEVGTIQTGIDGFRVVAGRTGKLSGIRRGATYDDNGQLIGAWAEIFRSDWQHPAREEVSFKEYCQKKKDGSPMGLWATMPETMIKKVAEAAALRMAFPEDLSGIYTHDEMQQADVVVEKLNAEKPAERARTEPDKSEHWCSEHKTKFFKSAKMKSYAHPVEGTDPVEWCHEPTPQAVTPKSEPVEEQPSPIDLTWLKEALDKIEGAKIEKWNKKDVLARLNVTVGGDYSKISEAVRQLSAEQAADFASEVADMLKML